MVTVAVTAPVAPRLHLAAVQTAPDARNEVIDDII